MAEIVIVPDPMHAGALVADLIIELIRSDPFAVLGLATGSTPTSVYAALASRVAELDVAQVRGFALDEYLGLPSSHPQSYRSVISREVVEPLGLDPAKVWVPRGTGASIGTAGEEFEAAIATAGGIDLQLLGIGTDGHIGFNEPGSSLASKTRIKTLTRQTRKDNARFFGSIDDVPTHCITQGLSTILGARHLVLLAFGQGKASAVAAAVEGPLTATVPASVIQLHPRATVIIDDEAASHLANTEYYRDAYYGKAVWQ